MARSLAISTNAWGTTGDFDDTRSASYELMVTVSDRTFSDIITVTISVKDVTDDTNDANNPPVFDDTAPGYDSSANTFKFTVAENSDLFIGRVKATDADTDDELTYSLGGTHSEFFDLDITTGRLSSKESLDYEHTRNSDTYTVTVTVSDGNTSDNPAPITVTITVTNLNEAPVFGTFASPITSIVREVDENMMSDSDVDAVVPAVDPEPNTVLIYSIPTMGDAALFTVESNSDWRCPVENQGGTGL